MDPQVIYGEVPVTSSVSSAQTAPLEDIVKIGKGIWKKVKAEKFVRLNHRNVNVLIEELQLEFKDFAESFPVILRWMVQAQEFNPKVFSKFLREYAKSTKMATREDFIKLQSEYIVLMYIEKHPHPSKKTIEDVRSHVTKQMLAEDKKFTAIEKVVRSELVDEEEQQNTARREAIYKLLTNT